MKNNLYCNFNDLRVEFNEALILNPTENIPWKCNEDTTFAEGLYIPEDSRGKHSKVCFAGRSKSRDLMTSLYDNWERALGAKTSSFKLYSGLHAHIVLFMSIADIGDKVLIIPENAGGHYATAQILRRLGLSVKECIIDESNCCINVEKTTALINDWHPKFIFVDRSDGLNYEDFSWMKRYNNIYKIFDASQYLTHILAGDYKNPFDMGMDLILTTLHKNYPGPQKAAFFSKECDAMWENILSGVATYVSNSHPKEIFKAVLTFPSENVLREYSQNIFENTMALENALLKNQVPVVKRKKNIPITQQIWIPVLDDDFGYDFFTRLEKLLILTNYRRLPYNLGRGLRLGTAAATRQGLTTNDAVLIGDIIAETYYTNNISDTLMEKAKKTITKIKNNKNLSFSTEAL